VVLRFMAMPAVIRRHAEGCFVRAAVPPQTIDLPSALVRLAAILCSAPGERMAFQLRYASDWPNVGQEHQSSTPSP